MQPASGRGAGQGRYGGGVSQVQGRPPDPAPGAAATGRRAGGSLGGRAEIGDIPGPVRPSPRTGDRDGRRGWPSSSFLDEIAAIIPPEVAALRPEDLRVEAEFFGKLTGEPAPPPPAADPFPFPVELTGTRPPSSCRAGPTEPEPLPSPRRLTTESSLGNAPAASSFHRPLPVTTSVAVPEANVVVPPISIEPPAIRPPRPPSRGPFARSCCRPRSCSPGRSSCSWPSPWRSSPG